MSTATFAGRAGRAALWLLATITVILTGWVLHATGTFMVPLVFAIFFALLAAPLDRRVAERVPGKVAWLGHVSAMGAILVSSLLFVGLLWIAAQQVVERVPIPGGSGSLLPQFGTGDPGGSAPDAGAGSPPGTTGSGMPGAAEATSENASGFGDILGRFGQVFSGAGGSLVERFGGWASDIAMQILSAASSTLIAAVLVFFLTLLMLIEGPNWRQKLMNVLDESASRKAMDAIDIIADRLRRYLLARAALGVITAFLYVAWLWIFGVDLLLVWALLAFLLNFVPTLGSLIIGALAVAYTFVQKDFGTTIAVGAGIFVIEQVMGNYVDPRVQGRQVALSSLVILITLLIWGWIWGVAGAILAVPITISVMIVCAHVQSLRPFALMLSNARDMEGLDRQACGSDP